MGCRLLRARWTPGGPSMAAPAGLSFGLFPCVGLPAAGALTPGLAQGLDRTGRSALGPYPKRREVTDTGTWEATSGWSAELCWQGGGSHKMGQEVRELLQRSAGSPADPASLGRPRKGLRSACGGRVPGPAGQSPACPPPSCDFLRRVGRGGRPPIHVTCFRWRAGEDSPSRSPRLRGSSVITT